MAIFSKQVRSAILTPCVLFVINVYGFSQNDGPIVVGAKDESSATAEEISLAESKLNTTRDEFRRISELAVRGSISEARRERAEFEFRSAELALDSMRKPELAARNNAEIAKLRLEFAENKFRRSKQLYLSGSLSEVRYRRDKYDVKLAQIHAKKAVGDLSDDAASLQAAKLALDLSRIELKLAEKLFQKRSISLSAVERLRERVQTNELKLNELQQKWNMQKKAIDRRLKT